MENSPVATLGSPQRDDPLAQYPSPAALRTLLWEGVQPLRSTQDYVSDCAQTALTPSDSPVAPWDGGGGRGRATLV